MAQFSIILNQIGGFFLYLLLGALLRRKTRMLNETSLFAISELTIKVALPAFIFYSTVTGTSLEDFRQMLPVLIVMILLYIVLYFLGKALSRLFGLTGNSSHAYRMCLTFGNVGLVGVPIVTELYPNTAMIVIAVATAVDQLMMWTYGVSLSYDVESEEAKNKVRLDAKRIKSILLNPPFLSIVISLIFVALRIPVPTFINNTLSKIGGMLTPLGMIYVGAMLEWKDIGYALKRLEIYVSIVIKMIVLPVAVYFFMTKAGIPSDISGVLAVILGVPVFMAATILAKNNGSDFRLAQGMLMLSTVAFMITYPIVSMLISMI